MRVAVEMWVAKDSGRELLALDPNTLTVRVLPYSLSLPELAELEEACGDCLDVVAKLQSLRTLEGQPREGAIQ